MRLVLWALLLCASGAHGQRAPVILEPGHWSYDAIRRLNAAGLAPAASDPVAATVTVQHVRAVFAYAIAEAERTGRYEFAELARGYARMLDIVADSTGIVAAALASAGWTSSAGEALAGEGYIVGEDFTGAVRLPAGNGPAVLVDAHGYLMPWLSWTVRGGHVADEWTVPAATLGFAFGAFDAWAGRRRLHYGAGRGGAIVAGSGVGGVPLFAHRTYDPLDGAGIHVRDPFKFPSFLRFLGASRIEITGGRLSRNGRIDSPWVIFGRLTTTPFSDRFTLGVNRGAVFGGEDNPATLRRVLGVLVGEHNEGFENQVISAVIRYRPPLGTVPLEAYLELGADDTAGALTDVPTYIAGIDLAAIPGTPAVSLGVEHTRFTGSCCGNPFWYRNVFFRGSWAEDGRLFAHPLGGHGYEWLAAARIDLTQYNLLVRTDVFTRWRGHENLFAPERAGSSAGGSVNIEAWRARTALRIEAGFEHADSWNQSQLAVILSHAFH